MDFFKEKISPQMKLKTHVVKIHFPTKFHLFIFIESDNLESGPLVAGINEPPFLSELFFRVGLTGKPNFVSCERLMDECTCELSPLIIDV